ncbi:MAG: Lrp/AsnC family transcriptional regulator [Spirochaetales bacterium]|nr:Lrp/AsnC family transcriptional regulator [Spirochaetales bacterium]
MKDSKYSPLDEIDWRISQELRNDARMPASEIARKLDLNPRTVRNRIDRIVELGAARAHWVFEPKVFGYVISVDIFLKIETESAADVICHDLINDPQVNYLAFGNGKETMSIEGLFKNLEEMDEFIYQKLPAYEGVRVESVALVPKVLRSQYEWHPDKSDFGN